MHDVAMSVIGYIDAVMKVITWTTALAVVFRFIGYRYKQSVLRIFQKNFFFGFFSLPVMLFTFRKDMAGLTRKFIEYLIFELGDEKLTHKRFRTALTIFKREYILENHTDYVFESVFDMERFIFSPYVKNYFEYFKKNKKKFVISNSEPLSFLLKLTISSGYVSQMAQIPGLSSHYNDDWSKIIDRYSECFKHMPDSNELFMFYMWIMWGPSYVVHYKDSDGKLVQYGIGDESKTIPVVLPSNDAGIKFWNDIKNSMERNETMGMMCELTTTIYDQKEFRDAYYDMFNSEAYPFFTRITNDDIPSICVYDSHYTKILSNEEKSFFAAYLWALFIKRGEGWDISKFNISNCVSFFEHANLADKANYTFLCRTLVNKIFKHFEEIYLNENATYHLNSTFNDHIRDLLQQKYEEEILKGTDFSKWLKGHLFFDSHISMGYLLSKLDELFTQSSNRVEIKPVVYGDVHSISKFCEFYFDTYVPCFPDINERETLENMMGYLKNEAIGKNGDNHYHILLAYSGDEVVGGVIGDYFSNSNCSVIEFIAVNENHRNKHIGSRLIAELGDSFKADAKALGKKNYDYMFIEVEDPSRVPTASKEMAERRITYWMKKGFVAANFNYVQPSLDKDKRPVSNLILGAKSIARDDERGRIEKEKIVAFLEDYAKYAMSIEFPKENETIVDMSESLNNVDSIELIPFAKYGKE